MIQETLVAIQDETLSAITVMAADVATTLEEAVGEEAVAVEVEVEEEEVAVVEVVVEEPPC